MKKQTFYEHQGVFLTVDLEGDRVFAHGTGRMGSVNGQPGAPSGTFAFIVDLPTQDDFLLELLDADGNTIGLADVKADEVRPEIPDGWKTAVSRDPGHDLRR